MMGCREVGRISHLQLSDESSSNVTGTKVNGLLSHDCGRRGLFQDAVNGVMIEVWGEGVDRGVVKDY